MTVDFQLQFLEQPIELGDDPKASRIATITGSDDPQTVSLRAESEFALFLDGYVHGQLVRIHRLAITLEHQGPKVWYATAVYGRKEPKEQNHFDVSFDIGGQSTNIKYAKEHIDSFPATGVTLADHAGAINVTDGVPQGLDIELPYLTFTETHYLPNTTVTDSFLALLYKLVGSVTSTPLRGFAAGELLMTRVSGSRRNSEQWQLTLSWAFSKNISGETINGVTGIDKKGWEYMWEEYEQEPDATSKRTKPKLLGYHVERIYEELDHAGQLGIFDA